MKPKYFLYAIASFVCAFEQAALAAIDKLPPFLNQTNVGEFSDLRDSLKSTSEKERLQTRRLKALDAVLRQFGG